MPHVCVTAGRGRRLLAGLVALAVLTAIVGGVPLVLRSAWQHLGSPLPSLTQLASPDNGTLFVRVLCLVGWIAWATFTWALAAEMLAQWRGWRLPALRWQQRAVAGLVASVSLMFASPAIVGTGATPVQAAAFQARPAAVTVVVADHTVDSRTAIAAAPTYGLHEVTRGEQLPQLAQHYYGDRYQWTRIAAANYGITQPDGKTLRPGETRVYPGWQLRIPTSGMLPTATPATASSGTPIVPIVSVANQATTGHLVYTVKHGDWLWFIAERYLGDPQRYPEIAALNPGLITATHGIHGPDHIEGGWKLTLPADAHDRGTHTHAAGTAHANGTAIPPATPPGGGNGVTPGSGATTPTPAQTAPAPSTPTPAPGASHTPTPHHTPTPSVDPSGGVTNPALSGAPSAPTIVGVAPSPRTATDRPTPSVTPSAGTSPSAQPSPEASTDSAPAPSSTHHGVDLGDLGWVTAEVAAAVMAAAALVWIQRRRHYRPGAPDPDRDDTDLLPDRRTIAAVHHARTPAEDDMDPYAPDQPDAATVTTASLGARPDRTLIRLPDLPARGVGLSGPGAAGAARGVLAAGLSAGGPWTPQAEAAVITTHNDLENLLPNSAQLPSLERMHTADTLDDALSELERQLLRRARLATSDADITSDPTDNPPPLVAPLVFLTAAPEGPHATRLAAILAVGSRLGIVALLHGDWPHGDTWHVRTDGTTRDKNDGPGTRLNVLDPVATLDILTTVAQARPDTDELPPAPVRAPALTTIERAVPVPAPHTDTAADTGDAPATINSSATSHGPQVEAPAPNTRPVEACRLQFGVLGRPTVAVITPDGHTDLRIRRTDGVQILVNLAVNPHGATSDELMAVLWPEVRPHYARSRFHTTMSELRRDLDESVHAEAIPRIGERYHLDPHHVDVDLWHVHAAIERAATALEPAAHDAALHEVIDLYHGTIAEGHSWLWLTPHREQVRRHILDAYIALADTAADPQTALGHIQDAIRLDPYNEDIYRRAMTLHARLGRLDGVRRTLRALSERLAELEVRVSPDTQQVAHDLVSRLDARQRVSGSAA